MDKDLLTTLSCPYCGYDLNVEKVFRESQTGINDGIVSCVCGEYPIASGILVLLKGNPIPRVIRHLSKEQFSEALNTLIEVRPYTRVSQLISLLERIELSPANKLGLVYKGIMNRPLFEDSKLSFFDIIDRLGWTTLYGDYLKYRFSHLDLVGNQFLIHSLMNIERAQKPVLDLCCGVGHHSFLMSRYVPTENIICADRLFVNLYLAKRFFVKDANLVCLDSNVNLPFRNDSFSMILCTDAFYSIRTKRLLANELKRIMNSNGISLISSLPNLLRTGRKYRGVGEAWTPQAYSGLFNDLNVRLFPQKRLVQGILTKDELNLEEKYPDSDVNSSTRLLLVATKNKSDLKDYKNPLESLFRRIHSNLTLSPFYAIIERENKVYLKKKLLNVPPIVLEMSYFKSMADQRFITKELLKLIERGNIVDNLDEAFDLWKSHVLIDVPKNYVNVLPVDRSNIS